MKGVTRCGMGPCQGRFCGLTVSELIAADRGLPVSRIGAARLRAPVKPVPLGELAALEDHGATDVTTDERHATDR